MREVVAEERAEQGLGRADLLDPFAVAAKHGIEVFTLEELPDEHCSDDAVQHFTGAGQAMWSAALIPLGSARVIVVNTSHSWERQRSSVAHELGHFLLEHDFGAVLLTDDGCRQFDPTTENQAKFFSGELLVPEKAAQWAAFREWSNAQVAEHFGVSEQFAQWRMSGARKFAQRALERQASSGR